MESVPTRMLPVRNDMQSDSESEEINYMLSVIEDENMEKLTTKEYLTEVFSRMNEKLHKSCTKKMLLRRVPFLSWLPRYSSEDFVGDLVAGITVGLTVIPQSLAYSNLAGLPTQYGLYSSFLGCFIYIILGSCKDVPIGPTAIMSLLAYQALRGKGPEYAVLLCFLNGVVELLMGLFGLGFIIDFISGPVSSGFTSAAALMIVTSQVKDVLAIPSEGNTFVQIWTKLFQNIDNTKIGDLTMGLICIVVLVLMRYLVKIKVGPNNESHHTRWHRIANKSIWLVATSRNAILVIVCGIIGYNLSGMDPVPFQLIGYLPPGMPEFKLPPFGFTKVDNGTSIEVSFLDMCSELGSGIVVLPLVSLLETIAICKAFSDGKPVDATQELIAMGFCNIGNSFAQAYSGCGSLSRSAVNNSSGVRTPLGGLYSGILVIFALLFFTPYFFFIPKAALAAIIIAAVIFMVEVHVVIPIWKTKKSDLIPGIGSFIACLVLQLELGILVGIGINILFILYHAARPKISVDIQTSPEGIEYLMLTPDRSLIFPSVDYVRNLVTKHGIRQPIPVVIDCSHIYGADYTAAKVIECLTQDFSSRKQPLFFYNLKPNVVSVFSGLQPKGFVVYYSDTELDDLIRDYQKQCDDGKVPGEMSVVTTG